MSELEKIVNDFVGSLIPDRHKKELTSALKSEFMKAIGDNREIIDPTPAGRINEMVDNKIYNQALDLIRQKIKEM
jgi:hypothetical protein